MKKGLFVLFLLLGNYYFLRALLRASSSRLAAIRRLPWAVLGPNREGVCTGFLLVLVALPCPISRDLFVGLGIGPLRVLALDATLLDRVIAILLPACLRICTPDWHCLFPY
jgi:hypothetical protein